MQLTRTAATVLSATAVAAGLAAAATPAQAQTSELANSTYSEAVVVGSIYGFRGNRHQFALSTTYGNIDSGSKIRSWYCPSGASITPNWASSRCTLRSTYKLVNFVEEGYPYDIGTVSSTGRSAQQIGEVRGKSVNSTAQRDLWVELSIFAHEGDPYELRGTVGDRSLQSSPRYAWFVKG